eukprot:4704571-Amphidinium_carterae.1
MRGATGRMEATEHFHSPSARGARHWLSLAAYPIKADGAPLRFVLAIGKKIKSDLAMEHSVSDVIPG